MTDTETHPGADAPETTETSPEIMSFDEAFDKGFKDYFDEEDEPAPLTEPAYDEDKEGDIELSPFYSGGEGPDDEPIEEAENNAEESEQQDDERETFEPLSFWSDELAERFVKMDPEVQRFILDTSKDSQAAFTRRTQEISDLAREFDGYRAIEERWKNRIAQYGYTGQEAFNYLMHVDDRLTNGTPAEKQQILQRILYDYDIDLTGQSTTQSTYLPPMDPNVTALQNEVGQLRSYMEQQRASEEAAKEEEAASELAQFADALSGNQRLHPFADDPDVCLKMAEIIDSPSGHLKSLEDIYEEAVWSLPSTRKQLIAAQTKKTSRTQTGRAERAKRAEALNTDAPVRETRKGYDHIKDPRKRLEAIVNDVF